MSINQGEKILASDVSNHINNKNNPHAVTASQIDGLATVATTGSYNDLKDKPNIPTNSLPSVTSADNGKILTVVNGVWTAFSNGARKGLTGSYDFTSDFWNYRGSGKTVTVTSLTLDSNYSYIEILPGSVFTITHAYDGSKSGTFPVTLVKGQSYTISFSGNNVTGYFLTLTYGTNNTITVTSGFSGHTQSHNRGGGPEVNVTIACYV